jgi:hypothetical protein
MLDPKYQKLVEQVETNWSNLSKRDLAIIASCKPVYLYNQDGTFFKEFESTTLATKYLFGEVRPIIKTAVSLRGYIISFEKKEKLTEEELKKAIQRSRRLRKVDQLDLMGNYIRTFNNISEAMAFIGETNNAGISRAIANSSKKCRGFKWRYHEE